MLGKYKKQLQNKNELYLRVKVRPGADKAEVKEIMADGTIKIDIVALPVKDKANQELIKFLAKEFEIRKNNVKIIKGTKDKIKMIKITRSPVS